MKFSTKEDINAPADAVFAMFSDFEVFERAAIRRGAEVRRTDRMTTPGPGMTWHAAFDMRGKRRQIEVEMVTFDRPDLVVLESISPGMLGTTTFQMTALSDTRTRLHVELELKPLNLSSRLLVQSLKLAKNSLTTKFKLSVGKFARQAEER
jgi:hypothetical protein